ncbi:pentatricopeptide repeat-containing protein At2g22410, mitochondrial-like [Magnolia sinica]|uniref:pentatricopeptide repeat-containing protein At2g22410, mitochondrial-like n=1 Tax=Magnolia sinica TaxID=86752 RepID=UPI00265B101A|nr:pentatricopeptide repeat-containing protein At2g22410, mitochondrial-like [Magnolia sinica]
MLRTKPCMQRLHPLLRDFYPSLPKTLILPSLPIPDLLDDISDVRKLHQIHAHMIITGIIKEPFAASRLLSSPAHLEFNYARSIFAHIPHPNLFTWNTMIKKFTVNGPNCTGPLLSFYREMLQTDLRPNGHTFMYLIRALAAGRSDVTEVEEIHACVLKLGFGYSQFVSSALIGLYVVVGIVDCGRQLFDEMPQPGLVLSTAMIRAYVCVSRPKDALELFQEMRMVGLIPDSVAVATTVSACSQLGDLGGAKKLHGFIIKSGIKVDAFVSCGLLNVYGDCGSLDLAHQMLDEMPQKSIVASNSLIHQYAEHGRLELAHKLFDKMLDRDVVSWNTIIGGFCHAGQCKEALALFREMEISDVKPNRLTFSSVLSACASSGALDTGIWVHARIEKYEMGSDGSLDPGLIDMYSKCGSIEKALQVFEKRSPRRDLFSWTSIICGLAMHGHAKHALHLFSQMLDAGIQPDDVTLVGVLNACAHAGLLDQGCKHFHSMENVYNLEPKIEHYGCMVDLLGRMGRLREAHDLIMGMPMKPNVVIWGTLLSACRVHNNVELGEIVAERMLEVDPSDQWVHVMLSNMYAEACRWDGVMRMRKEMKEKGMRKMPGCSSIEVNGTVQEFLVGDDLHPQHSEICCMLEKIEAQLTVM